MRKVPGKFPVAKATVAVMSQMSLRAAPPSGGGESDRAAVHGENKVLLIRNQRAQRVVPAVNWNDGFADSLIPVNAPEFVYLDTSAELFCGST